MSTIAIIEKDVSRLQDNESFGNNVIVSYWFKYSKFCISELTALFNNTSNGNIEISEWLTKVKPVIVLKNNDKRNLKNHRPIAFQNILLKLYTKCSNYLLQRHCKNHSVTIIE